ncbi:hypothetical protein XENOCAPTIV_024359 [Xenoophorus captivus]|uniref:PH domain-containing protein n=1 Tax=Xenoophorus captivus TaxID=1517983 RepID=A0ABV0SBB8_9TELE
MIQLSVFLCPFILPSHSQVIMATIERHKQNSETFNKAFNSSFSREDDHVPESPGPWSSTAIDSDGFQERVSCCHCLFLEMICGGEQKRKAAAEDVKGSRAVPLPGFEVSTVPPATADKPEVKHVFKLSHTQQNFLLSAQDAELQAKWVEVLSKAARAEAPTETLTSLTEHRKSQ